MWDQKVRHLALVDRNWCKHVFRVRVHGNPALVSAEINAFLHGCRTMDVGGRDLGGALSVPCSYLSSIILFLSWGCMDGHQGLCVLNNYAKHLNLNSLSILYKIWMLLMRRLWIDSSWILAVSLYFLHLASSDVWHKEGGMILLSAMDKRKSLFQMYTISWDCMLRQTFSSLFFIFISIFETHTHACRHTCTHTDRKRERERIFIVSTPSLKLPSFPTSWTHILYFIN